jgi:hypothetical protein
LKDAVGAVVAGVESFLLQETTNINARAANNNFLIFLLFLVLQY